MGNMDEQLTATQNSLVERLVEQEKATDWAKALQSLLEGNAMDPLTKKEKLQVIRKYLDSIE